MNAVPEQRLSYALRQLGVLAVEGLTEDNKLVLPAGSAELLLTGLRAARIKAEGMERDDKVLRQQIKDLTEVQCEPLPGASTGAEPGARLAPNVVLFTGVPHRPEKTGAASKS